MMKSRYATFCAVLLLWAAAASAAAAAAPRTHTLQKGETLYSISRRYDVPYEALASANSIVDPTKVRVGTILVIPAVHLVEKGDTLYGIARRYGTTVNELMASNKLASGYVLRPGDSLVVPGEPAAAEPIPPSSAAAPAPIASPPSQAPVQASPPASPAAVPAAAAATAAAVPAPEPPQDPKVPMPAALRTQDRTVDMQTLWPAPGKALYLDGKLEGIMIRVKPGESAKTVASGTVVSAGPSRGFGQVAFVQSKAGYVYVYGGNETLTVKTGDQVESGREIGKIGLDAKDGSPIAYFFVFRNGQSMDPALAPRD